MKVARALVGNAPRKLAWLLVPTALAAALDLVVRGGSLGSHLRELGAYPFALLVSAGVWVGPLWLASWLMRQNRVGARIGLGALFVLFVLPLAAFSYGGQALHYRVFHAYMSRDSVRYGIALRSTVADWFSQWGGALGFIAITAAGAAITFGFARAARRASTSTEGARPILPILGFVLAIYALYTDKIDTRALQIAPPDVCFAHGVVHAVRARFDKNAWKRRGIAVRTPAPLPKLPRAEHRPPCSTPTPCVGPNVLFVITESVRADAMCSEPPPACHGRFLDKTAADRIPMGRLATQSPGTVSACVLTWTGLSPTSDFASLHAAPTLWEIARAVGYRTAYISAQNLKDEDFGAFVQHAGIDVRVSGSDLGNVYSAWAGAPDESATARTLAFIEEVPKDTPYFAVMHLSNTHSPYRTTPELEPFSPHNGLPLGGWTSFHNHYRNAVLFQERTLSSFFGELRALPSFEDTVVVFISDHGEQFGEHGGLYHLHTLYDEEIRIPGFLLAGERALSKERREALATFANRRTYSQDVYATLLDLFGVFDARATLPFASQTSGRSLLRAASPDEPIVHLSTSSAVWDADGTVRGVIQGDHVLMEKAGHFECYDLAHDPAERQPLPAAACAPLSL